MTVKVRWNSGDLVQREVQQASESVEFLQKIQERVNPAGSLKTSNL